MQQVFQPHVRRPETAKKIGRKRSISIRRFDELKNCSEAVLRRFTSQSFNPTMSSIYRDGRWTEEEHNIFVEAYKEHGKDWMKVSSIVGTRSNVQCRTHAQNYEVRLNAQRKAKLEADNKVKIEAERIAESFRNYYNYQRAFMANTSSFQEQQLFTPMQTMIPIYSSVCVPIRQLSTTYKYSPFLF